MLEKINAIDEKISSRFRMDNGESKWWKLVTFFGHSGDSWFWLIGLILVVILKPDWRNTSVFLIGSIIGLAVIVMLVKLVVRRSRPPGEWGAIYRNTDPHSFPSGHAARATMLATIAVLIGPLWAALMVAIWALLVCLSRILSSMHYFSDVFAGMLLGIAAGQIAVLFKPWLTTLLQLIV